MGSVDSRTKQVKAKAGVGILRFGDGANMVAGSGLYGLESEVTVAM